MSERIAIPVAMVLLSDAIPGSGESIPGGADIGVYTDRDGYPYFKATSFKGLLRESLCNVAAWTGAGSGLVPALLGEEGWTGTASGRRINLTALTLDNRPDESFRCFGRRAFTKLENGTAMKGSLRECECVCKGLIFSGIIECAAEDEEILTLAVKNIKWIGSNRSRGFGSVKTSAGKAQPLASGRKLTGNGSCIHYVLRSESPVIITNLSASSDNNFGTRKYIPGSAVRGMVMEHLSSERSDWFKQNLSKILTAECRFLPAYPGGLEKSVIPSLMGFYENKNGGEFCSVLKDGSLAPGLKRAGLGDFCTVSNGRIRYFDADTDDATRIIISGNPDDTTKMFQTEYLSAGQCFEGYILLGSPEMAETVAEAFGSSVWIGADRYEGFGRCSVETLELCDRPAYLDAYGLKSGDMPGTTVYMAAVTPFTMTDEAGEPCGINTEALAAMLDCGSVSVEFCSTSVSEYGSYNRKWQCRSRTVRMYDAGSVFKLVCGCEPDTGRIVSIQDSGIGLNTEEGYGRILFMSASLFEGISGKEQLVSPSESAAASSAEIRRCRYAWIMKTAGKLKGDKKHMASSSQKAEIQNICDSGSVEALREHMKKQLEDRGAYHKDRFTAINELIEDVLARPLSDTLGCSACGEGSDAEKLELLSMLINYDRKEQSR